MDEQVMCEWADLRRACVFSFHENKKFVAAMYIHPEVFETEWWLKLGKFAELEKSHVWLREVTQILPSVSELTWTEDPGTPPQIPEILGVGNGLRVRIESRGGTSPEELITIRDHVLRP
jgi:hypothetical protein